MRKEIANAIIELSKQQNIAFLTGDLGFMALEPIREALGNKFINAGVSEQNMISVAAGLTFSGLQAWVYSIAPFCYARPFEQIRNDACFNKRPIKLIANGGGYGYGVMGATHHALEDYGILSTLPNMQCFIPAFAADVNPIVNKMAKIPHPCYLRLGRCEKPANFTLEKYHPWRRLVQGHGPLLIFMGPLVGSFIEPSLQIEEKNRPEIWVATELPLSLESIPTPLLKKLADARNFYVIEEHVATGGFGQQLLWLLLKNDFHIPRFFHGFAKGYISGKYGSQQFHRKESGIDLHSIFQSLNLTLTELSS
ncbi:transketolase [Gammaproteobacteria bacterium SCGC AG-212-F23]|nr:transketolase [Gammaproteobacteria bacterium SCGC AG-212-F23]